jgi:hypothetical protein
MAAIGIGIGLSIGKSGASFSSYWKSRTDLFLFFGETSKITGGKLYNQMNGSTDWLTVAGSPNTFQTPNTAAYIAADTDYIWWRTDGSARPTNTTTAELIGYDLPRTLVKYDNAAPNTIRWIAILKSTATPSASDYNKLHTSFDLPLFWSGVLNVNGVLKSNRGLAQQLWTPESVYEAETAIILAAMTTAPDATRAGKINDFVLGLKTDSLWAKLDVLQVYAAHAADSSLLNWKNPGTDDAVLVSTPAFAVDEGYTGAAGKYINSNFNPGDGGAYNFVQDSAFVGLYCRTNVTETKTDFGSYDGTRAFYGYIKITTIGGRVRLNDNTNHDGSGVSSSLGMHIYTRTASNVVKGYENGTERISATTASNGVPNNNMFVLTSNLSGSPDTVDTKQIAVFCAGSGLSAAQAGQLTTRVEAFMDAIGKGVV